MCGIVGFTGPEDGKLLLAMCHTLIHRGPDDEGYYNSRGISLGMRRLAIVDLESGRQPISNETRRIWTVFNGEIYNHQELRQDLVLKGHVFHTHHSDTEVIVHLYEEYGDEWVSRINGMFGLAIWDEKEKKLLLYRDRTGKKPLYYSAIDGQIVFGSEIKSVLIHPAVSKELNFKALYHYFGLKNISAPDTAYMKIQQLLPGHFLVWKDGHLATHCYWSPDFLCGPQPVSEEEAVSEISRLLEDAVKIRMQCDAPFGAYLSGGMDSSAVVSLMSRQSRKPIKTFCLGYEDEPKGQFAGKAQDLNFARSMSRQLGTEHHEYIINSGQFMKSMPEVLAAFDEPFSGTISTFFLSILIHKHVKVALSGDGADELFGSYLAHRVSFPLANYLSLNRKGKIEWQDISDSEKKLLAPFDTPQQFAFLKTLALKSIPEWRDRLAVFQIAERRQLLSGRFFDVMEEESGQDVYEKIVSDLTATDPLNRNLEIDQRELLPNQVLPFVDRLSMAHSIEVRCPFLDYRLVEYVNHLPGTFKIRDCITKYILRKVVSDLLPAELINRPKEGFVQPNYTWMHGPLKKEVKGLLESLPGEFFQGPYLKQLIEGFEAGKQDLNAKVWNLACFSIWYNNSIL